MTRRLIISITAFTFILTGMAMAPARAQSGDEIGRALAGAIAFFVVGNVIASALDGKGTGSGKPKAVSTSKSKQYGNYWDIPKQGRPDRGRFGEHRHKVLPRHCFFVINHRGQRVGVFGQKCLSEFLHKSKWLPRACVRTIPVRNDRWPQRVDATL